MENSIENHSAQDNSFHTHVHNLRIDRVLSTQPELGPSVPDGGYGWIIFLATSYFQITIPSISISYGMFLMYSTLEDFTDHSKLFLWDNLMISTPILFIAIWTIMDPICRILIANSKWPRLMGLTGVCLTCSGILFLWLAVGKISGSTFYILSGLFSGIGTALSLTQCEILISQYFKRKLFSVNLLLRMFVSTGFILIPFLLSRSLNKFGISYAVIWYHLYILIGALASTAFRKPDYLKGRNVYKNRRNSEDEEDIFSKTGTELQTTRIVENINHEELASTSENVTSEKKDNFTATKKSEWEQFSDDECAQDGEINSPRELFTNLQMNNNTTYSFDNNIVSDADMNNDNNIFLPINRSKEGNWEFFQQATFYSSLLLQITIKFSSCIFYTLYPSMLYFSTYLHKEKIAIIISYTFFSCFVLNILFGWIKNNRRVQTLYIALFCLMGSLGCFMIGDVSEASFKIVGGIFVALSIHGLDYFSESILKLSIKSEPNRMYTFINLLCGTCLVFLLITNMNYISYFRLISITYLICGSLWFCNFVWNFTTWRL